MTASSSSATGVACPLCGARTRPAFAATDRNRAVSTRVFHYRRCEACDAYSLADVPEDLGRYYPEEYYGLPTPAQLESLAAAEAFKARMLLRHVAPGPLTDVGAGYGVFCRAASNAGFEVRAVEMDGRAADYLRDVVGVEAIRSDRPQEALAAMSPSRAITMWHSIEHLPDPWAVLEAAAANLQAGGVLLIATPNPQAMQFRLLRGRWAHVDAPRHLYLIPAATLERRAADCGLSQVALTTGDPAGRHWNRFGWEYALRRFPAIRPAGRLTVGTSFLLAGALRPVEATGLRGAAYTGVFVKRA